MSNMEHCRFNNTLDDLRECYEHWNDADISTVEQQGRKHLLRLCQTITHANIGQDLLSTVRDLTKDEFATLLLDLHEAYRITHEEINWKVSE